MVKHNKMLQIHHSENAYIRLSPLPRKKFQCCESGMFIPDPDFYASRIPDLGSLIQKQQQKRGVEKNLLSYLFMYSQISQN